MKRIEGFKSGSAAHFLKRFIRKEGGSITIESVIILPMLLWSVFASYTFYDSYRQSARNIKAAYAVADVLSRERNAVTKSYIDTMHNLMESMVSTRAPVSMRVSYVIYEEPRDGHRVLWSCVRGTTYPQLTTANADFLKEALPTMPNGGSMIIVETVNTYRAPFNIGFGFDDYDMGNFVFTHPRFYDNIEPETAEDC